MSTNVLMELSSFRFKLIGYTFWNSTHCGNSFDELTGAWIIVMELYPGFALYRGLYEFAQYAFNGIYLGTDGMKWADLSDSKNGMSEVLIIMAVEWVVTLLVVSYLNQIISSGSRKSPLHFLQSFRNRNKRSSFKAPSLKRQGSEVSFEMDKLDVMQEVRIFYLLFISKVQLI